ncbi:hypothetical protein PAXRUDRAFT_531603 [Paxillus rubicundulus Ve08.2h10]|uniref:Uncharacterized protein n=1 Tax=Paxillus rubicundulus Ve08.2h10 TaxID=930991 RepID=A0A0D0DN03_9AGAM|nr:hypothetical protein PAXRUDRAFT_531603 [Paxillus rubicundulus Ve08.2h10]
MGHHYFRSTPSPPLSLNILALLAEDELSGMPLLAFLPARAPASSRRGIDSSKCKHDYLAEKCMHSVQVVSQRVLRSIGIVGRRGARTVAGWMTEYSQYMNSKTMVIFNSVHENQIGAKGTIELLNKWQGRLASRRT